MNIQLRRFYRFVLHNKTAFSLSVSCALGLIFGACSASLAGDTYFELLKSSAGEQTHLIYTVFSAVLPFLFVFTAVCYQRVRLLYPICFLKAFSMGMACYACRIAFGSGAWLIRYLLYFPDILLFPILCWLALRVLSQTANTKRDVGICISAVALICGLYHFIISPFLVMLINI